MSPRSNVGEDVTNATKVLTEAAGQLTAAVAVLSAKVSPKPIDHGACKDNCLASVKSSPSGSGSPFHGFATSEIPSAAASEDLLHYLLTKDHNAGLNAGVTLQGIRQCSEQIPAAPAGSHVHHIYVDDAECEHEEADNYNFAKEAAVDGANDKDSDSSGEEEEIRVEEKRQTVVTMGKKRSKGKANGNKAKYQKMI